MSRRAAGGLLALVTVWLPAVEVARAQPLVPPPEAVSAPERAPSGLTLVSPWLTTGWDDGLAEVAEYDLQQFRYGNMHPGTATMVAVREAMSERREVKATAADSATVPVLKLHWVRSFQTGVYRYDQASFQLIRQADGMPLRWLITSHEWCGAASKSWVNGGPLRVSSYFDGHGDLQQPLDLSSDAVLADSLWWWARAWVAAGAKPLALRIVPSQIEARCIDTTPVPASISSEPGSVKNPLGAQPAEVPAVIVSIRRGAFIDRLVIAADDRHAVLSWQQADGSILTLRSIRRFAYWAQHDPINRPAQP